MTTTPKPLRVDLAAEMRRRFGLGEPTAEAAPPLDPRFGMTDDELRRLAESERRRGEIEHDGAPTGLLAAAMRRLLAERGWPPARD